jgi:hypothetical protein
MIALMVAALMGRTAHHARGPFMNAQRVSDIVQHALRTLSHLRLPPSTNNARDDHGRYSLKTT